MAIGGSRSASSASTRSRISSPLGSAGIAPRFVEVG
jgi:hypothetical protein